MKFAFIPALIAVLCALTLAQAVAPVFAKISGALQSVALVGEDAAGKPINQR